MMCKKIVKIKKKIAFKIDKINKKKIGILYIFISLIFLQLFAINRIPYASAVDDPDGLYSQYLYNKQLVLSTDYSNAFKEPASEGNGFRNYFEYDYEYYGDGGVPSIVQDTPVASDGSRYNFGQSLLDFNSSKNSIDTIYPHINDTDIYEVSNFDDTDTLEHNIYTEYSNQIVFLNDSLDAQTLTNIDSYSIIASDIEEKDNKTWTYTPETIDIITGDFDASYTWNTTNDNADINGTYSFDGINNDKTINGSYSFTNDSLGSNPSEWSTVEVPPASVQVISDIGNHFKVVELSKNDNNRPSMSNTFDNSQTDGTVEFWYRTNDIVQLTAIRLRSGTTQAIIFGIESSKFRFYKYGWQDVGISPINDVWYHIRFDFDCITDTYDIIINGVEYCIGVDFYASVITVDNFQMEILSGITNIYIDAIGYSWSNDEDGNQYDINDNTYPFNWFTSLEGGSINIIDLDNHNDVIEINDTNTNSIHFSQYLNDIEYGSIEFWIRGDNTAQYWIWEFLNDGTNAFNLKVQSDFIAQQDVIGWGNIVGVIDNMWYHVRIDFDCTTSGYSSLSQYNLKVFINGVEYGDYDFKSNEVHINQIKFSTSIGDSGFKYYIDAIGYSWDTSYDIADNTFPYEWYFERNSALNTLTIETDINDHNEVIDMYDNDSSSNIDFRYYTDSVIEYGTVEFWISSDDCTDGLWLILTDSNDNDICRLFFDETKIQYYDGSWNDLGTEVLTDNEWTHIRVDFENTDGNYLGLSQYKSDVYINSVKYGTFETDSSLALEYIKFYTEIADLNYHYYIDAVGFSWDSDYSVSDNLIYTQWINSTIEIYTNLFVDNSFQTLLDINISLFTSAEANISISLYNYTLGMYSLLNTTFSSGNYENISYFFNITKPYHCFDNSTSQDTFLLKFNYTSFDTSCKFYLDKVLFNTTSYLYCNETRFSWITLPMKIEMPSEDIQWIIKSKLSLFMDINDTADFFSIYVWNYTSTEYDFLYDLIPYGTSIYFTYDFVNNTFESYLDSENRMNISLFISHESDIQVNWTHSSGDIGIHFYELWDISFFGKVYRNYWIVYESIVYKQNLTPISKYVYTFKVHKYYVDYRISVASWQAGAWLSSSYTIPYTKLTNNTIVQTLELQFHVKSGNFYGVDKMVFMFDLIVNYNESLYSQEFQEASALGFYSTLQFSYECKNPSGYTSNYEYQALRNYRYLIGGLYSDTTPFNIFFDIPYINEDLEVAGSIETRIPKPETPEEDEIDSLRGDYWEFTSYTIQNDELEYFWLINEFEYSYIELDDQQIQYMKIKGKKQSAKYPYETETWKRSDLPSMKFKWGVIRVNFNFFRNAFIDIMNLLSLFVQWIGYLLTYAFQSLLYILYYYVFPTMWNRLIYSGLSLLWIILGVFLLVIDLLIIVVIYLYETFLIPFIEWCIEDGLPLFVEIIIIFLAFIIALTIWCITLGQSDFESVFLASYTMLHTFADFMIDSFIIFVNNIDAFLLYILYYFILIFFCIYKTWITKARGFKKRSEQLETSLEAYILPIIWIIKIISKLKELIGRWT